MAAQGEAEERETTTTTTKISHRKEGRHRDKKERWVAATQRQKHRERDSQIDIKPTTAAAAAGSATLLQPLLSLAAVAAATTAATHSTTTTTTNNNNNNKIIIIIINSNKLPTDLVVGPIARNKQKAKLCAALYATLPTPLGR
jgi:hypothetical protein